MVGELAGSAAQEVMFDIGIDAFYRIRKIDTDGKRKFFPQSLSDVRELSATWGEQARNCMIGCDNPITNAAETMKHCWSSTTVIPYF